MMAHYEMCVRHHRYKSPEPKPKEIDRRQKILDTLGDTVGCFLYYNRKEDEDLPRGEIEAAVKDG
jgi:hypothetical protein